MPLLRPRAEDELLIRPTRCSPELPQRPGALMDDDIEAPDDDRVRARISDAIRSRVRRPNPVTAATQARLAAGDGRAMDRLHLSPALRAEPPLTASHARRTSMTCRTTSLPRTASARSPPEYAMPEGQPSETLKRRVVQHAARKAAAPSRRAMADAQPSLPLQAEAEAYEFPPLTLLTSPETIERHHLSDTALEENARMLESVLDDYGVKGEIVSVRPGPVVTMYELEPAPGLKASRVIGLADDIARSMSALSRRVSPPCRAAVIGIELPNQHREKVVLREILSHRDFGDGTHRLPLALGKDIGGDPIIANLAKMPHLLIAGTTGSGKSVAINTMILSLLYKLTPEECRMIMIDPKMLELSVYDGIPHLLSPVVTDPKKAVVALKWVVGEMEERYRKMSKMGVRNIDGYNGRVAEALKKGEMFKRTVQTGFDDETGEPVFETEEFAPEKMPFIVVIVDEMADLMMVAGKEIEACIQRLAQMARASGIHIIMATQRPSVDVITGTIKANFPTRISFQVTSKVDSRTILGEMGAEQLLGMGDMLYMAGGAKITRVHGPFVSDEEVEEIVSHLKSFGPPDYAASVLDGPDEDKESDIDAVLGLNTGGNTTGEDALYDQAVAIVIKDRKCSTSYIQRKLGIGYNKAARLVEQMEEQRARLAGQPRRQARDPRAGTGMSGPSPVR
jgi:S-DNA-T family DNA segregation ATPase FtsK/SpoIIIE